MMYTKTEIVDPAVFKRAIQFFLFSASITVLAAMITYMMNPDIKGILKWLGENSTTEIKDSTSIDKVWSYVMNNGFVVPLQMLLFAFIPVQFLYLLNVVSTSSLLGVVLGLALLIEEKGIALIIASIPHAVFEIFAYCLFAAILFELNQAIRAKIKYILKKNKEGHAFINKFVKTTIVYAVFVLPIIVAAAFLETYIADIIIDLFQ